MQVQHEQRHGDGEDAVAERLRAPCLAHGHRVILIVHVEVYTAWVAPPQPRRRVPIEVAQASDVVQSDIDSVKCGRLSGRLALTKRIKTSHTAGLRLVRRQPRDLAREFGAWIG